MKVVTSLLSAVMSCCILHQLLDTCPIRVYHIFHILEETLKEWLQRFTFDLTQQYKRKHFVVFFLADKQKLFIIVILCKIIQCTEDDTYLSWQLFFLDQYFWLTHSDDAKDRVSKLHTLIQVCYVLDMYGWVSCLVKHHIWGRSIEVLCLSNFLLSFCPCCCILKPCVGLSVFLSFIGPV